MREHISSSRAHSGQRVLSFHVIARFSAQARCQQEGGRMVSLDSSLLWHPLSQPHTIPFEFQTVFFFQYDDDVGETCS